MLHSDWLKIWKGNGCPVLPENRLCKQPGLNIFHLFILTLTTMMHAYKKIHVCTIFSFNANLESFEKIRLSTLSMNDEKGKKF